MNIVIIINPIAGANQRRPELKKLIKKLRSDGINVHLHKTFGPGNAQKIAKQAAEYADAVLAVGGDGTICEIANGLNGSQVPLMAWPSGTENLFAKSFGFRANATHTLACLSQGKVVPIDVGIANRRSFLIIAGVGFDAAVVERVVQARLGHITHLSYGGPLWRTFWEYRFPPLHILSEGQPIWNGRGLVFIGNMPRYSLGLRIVRDARPDDGLLDLCILPCCNQAQLIGHSLRSILRKHIEHPGVIYQRFRHIRIESDFDVPVELDGEFAGRLPLDVTVKPAAICVKVPPKHSSG